jgi:GT2 family glycosyltransferase
VRVAAIVVAWNAAADLPACLDALLAQDHADLEVIVVDNASRDATPEVIRAAVGATKRGAGAATQDGAATEDGAAGGAAEGGRPKGGAEGGADRAVRHRIGAVWNTTNRGFCGGVNDALATIDDDIEAVLLVNPDAIAAPDLVRRAVAVLVARPDVGTVQPRVRRRVPAGAPATIDTTGHVLTSARLVDNRGEGELDDGRYPAGEVFGASGALVLHRRTMLEDVAWREPSVLGPRPHPVQYLTEDLFAYFDDVELDWRARLHGWRTWYEPTAVGVHQRGGAGPRRSTRVEALNFSNRLLVLVTCDDLRSLLRQAPLVAVTTVLKTVELALTVPAALPEAVGRLRLLPAARRRRRVLRDRVGSPAFAEVTRRWVVPFRWRPWIGRWWARTRPRA